MFKCTYLGYGPIVAAPTTTRMASLLGAPNAASIVCQNAGTTTNGIGRGARSSVE